MRQRIQAGQAGQAGVDDLPCCLVVVQFACVVGGFAGDTLCIPGRIPGRIPGIPGGSVGNRE